MSTLRQQSAAHQRFEADVQLAMRFHIPQGYTAENFPVIYGTAYAKLVQAEARKRLAEKSA